MIRGLLSRARLLRLFCAETSVQSVRPSSETWPHRKTTNTNPQPIKYGPAVHCNGTVWP